MVLVEGLIFFLLVYWIWGLSFYLYAVLKSWEITKIWNFEIKDGYVAGICEYPKWLLYWLEWLCKKENRNRG